MNSMFSLTGCSGEVISTSTQMDLASTGPLENVVYLVWAMLTKSTLPLTGGGSGFGSFLFRGDIFDTQCSLFLCASLLSPPFKLHLVLVLLVDAALMIFQKRIFLFYVNICDYVCDYCSQMLG